jgi:hypothetical protein
MVPLPAAANIAIAVVVPFYSEPGYTLARTVQALALQRADMQRYAAVVDGVPADALPELHVFAIADGWRKPDGAPILSDSMFEELLKLYGPTLDVDELLRFMGDLAFDDEAAAGVIGGGGDGERVLPDHVLLQFVVPAGPGEPAHPSGTVLEPLALDTTWASSMHARDSMPATGRVPSGFAAAAYKESTRLQQQQREAKKAAAKDAADKAVAAQKAKLAKEKSLAAQVAAMTASGRAPRRSSAAPSLKHGGVRRTTSTVSFAGFSDKKSVSSTSLSSQSVPLLNEEAADVEEAEDVLAPPAASAARTTGPVRRLEPALAPHAAHAPDDGVAKPGRAVDARAEAAAATTQPVPELPPPALDVSGDDGHRPNEGAEAVPSTPNSVAGSAAKGADSGSGRPILPLFLTIMIKRQSA